MAEGRVRRALVRSLAVVGGITLAGGVSLVVLLGMALNGLVGDFRGARAQLFGTSKSVPGKDSVAGIVLEGEIHAESAKAVVEKLLEAKEDKRLHGVLLVVNSPGGGVVASQEIYDAVESVRSVKPVVGYLREVAASGGYYSSSPCSLLIANRGTMVGSIGVLLSSLDTTQLMAWAKLRPVTLKTGALKDAGSGQREWTQADRDYFQKLLEDTREQFVRDIEAARKLHPATLAHMADGRVVLGEEAVKLGLVDHLGSQEVALAELGKLAEITGPQIHWMEDRELPHVLGEIFRMGMQSLASSPSWRLEARGP